MVDKIKNLIKDINLNWFDLFIIPWAAATVFLVIESNKMIRVVDHYILSIPFVFHTIFFVIAFISFAIFIFYQWKKGIKVHHVFSIGLLILLIFGAIAIFTQQDVIKVTVTFSEEYTRTSTTTISLETKFVFYYTFLLVISFFYFGFFILPKRINNLSTIIMAIFFFYAFAIVALIYSIIVDPYINFIKALFTDIDAILHNKDYLPMSFFGNPNTFAFFLQEGIFASLLHYELTKNKKILIIPCIFYLFLLFTMCKAGIVITTSLILLIIIIRILIKFNEQGKKKAFIWTISIIGAVITTTLLVVFGISSIRNKLIEFINNNSMQDRRSIWIASITIIKERPLIFGNGYGVYNSILLDATSIGKWNSTTHNFLLSILGRAGIIGVICFFVCLGYCTYQIIKNVKDRSLLLIMLFGITMFFIHSFVDESYYPALVNCIIASVCVRVLKQDNIQEDN